MGIPTPNAQGDRPGEKRCTCKTEASYSYKLGTYISKLIDKTSQVPDVECARLPSVIYIHVTRGSHKAAPIDC